MLSPDLVRTLEPLAAALSPARDDWWIIGSAAVALHGVTDLNVADVDVLLSTADACNILTTLRLDPRPGAPDTLFRSAIFATWRGLPLTVEFMAGFELRRADGWVSILPTTRQCIAVREADVFVPTRAELQALLAAFDRPKDRDRARLLSALDRAMPFDG